MGKSKTARGERSRYSPQSIRRRGSGEVGQPHAKASPEHFIFPACENHKIDSTRPIASFRTAWRNATKTAGLPGLRFHDLRHTAITKLAESNASEGTVMAIAGARQPQDARTVFAYPDGCKADSA